ncbi:MAG: FHIPEP family type III secretion protein, partial [Enterobacter hormaechei]|nr:FHIPEP family type III secretion protein [Enterobacter hormaechei]
MANLVAMLRLPGNLKSTQWQILAGPILILLILSMMVLPLPAFILDLLFTFNIALSIMVLLVAMFTQRTLEFAAFPTILLFTTLLRLALNVASTRIILMEGHTGAAAAGKVVEAFGHFLVGGNFAIGIVVFVILVIINFMVITKGAGRIAEVGARFVLDGMPGKQMAIDADLNAGLIAEDEAKKRRAEVTQEADFYGSMDGASKFVRGDAIAGILIMVINVVGGLLVEGVKDRLRPDLQIHVAAAEVEFWRAPDFSRTAMPEGFPDALRAAAKRFAKEYHNQIRQFDEEHEVAPGVVVRRTGGHTPGH